MSLLILLLTAPNKYAGCLQRRHSKEQRTINRLLINTWLGRIPRATRSVIKGDIDPNSHLGSSAILGQLVSLPMLLLMTMILLMCRLGGVAMLIIEF
ncbi:MAG: hypothetical protein J3Q66DRAFT_109719 [Benniella sp.]|nr:MAG: hypothetical protein J3Q66DRAFT_109719 [Benniella sp.]